MKEITVNKLCFIDNSNIALSKERKAVAINIVQEVEDEKGFINYCLAIDGMQQCCEDFSAGMVKFYKVDDDEAEGSIFVSKIYHNADTDIKWLEKTLSEKGFAKDEIERINFSGITTLVYGKDEELLVIAYVYNEHNGCYWHEVTADINGNIEYSGL